MESGISPISSRKIVPPSALRKCPSCFLSAPVNAPFSCPNSSEASKDSVRAAQFTATNGPRARRLAAWTALATSSLPVPDSPVISTVASVGAMVRTISQSARMDSLRPTMPVCASVAARLRDRVAFSRISPTWAKTLRNTTLSFSKSRGLVR